MLRFEKAFAVAFAACFWVYLVALKNHRLAAHERTTEIKYLLGWQFPIKPHQKGEKRSTIYVSVFCSDFWYGWYAFALLEDFFFFVVLIWLSHNSCKSFYLRGQGLSSPQLPLSIPPPHHLTVSPSVTNMHIKISELLHPKAMWH